MTKDEKILLEIYRRMYKASTPSADFDQLMADAEINKWGQKEIRYMDYEIGLNDYEKIIEDTFKEFKVPVSRRKNFRVTVALGCSPKSKKEC